MSLITDIRSIAQDISSNCTFILSSDFRANVKAHELKSEDLPYIVMDNTFSKSNEIKKNNSVIASARIRIRFLDKDDPLKTDLEKETIRQAMEDLAHRMAVRIYQLERVRPIGNQTYLINPVFNYYAKDMSGVMLEMTVDETLIINFC